MQSSKIALVATAVLAATSSWAFVDAPISGKRLVMRDTPTPKIVFVSKAAVPGPTVTGSDDPTFFGATLTVISMGGETASIDLPASGWTASGGVFVSGTPWHPPASPPSAPRASYLGAA